MDTDVIVVGAGPVGLLLACELRLGGASVVVLERMAAPTTESRASTLHARTMEILDQRGLLADIGTAPNRPTGHFGGLPLDFSGLATRYPGLWSVPQTRIEQMLANRATSLGAEIRRSHEVTALHQSTDDVVVHSAGADPLTAAYVVGCDGENSTVREQTGIRMSGSKATRELLRADIAEIEVPDRRFERRPTGLAIAGRLPSGATRLMVSEFTAVPTRTTAPTFAEFSRAWQRVTGEDITHGTPIWLNACTNANHQADNYRAGRVLLAGDAAHPHLPSGGQAINLGLQDAMNLGWKLAAEAAGQAPAGLLDTYHQERHPTGQRVLANVAAQTALLLGTDVDPLRTLLTDLLTHPTVRDQLTNAISGLDIRYGQAEHPLTGTRMPHLTLDNTSTTALLRPATGLLLNFAGARATELRASTETCARPVTLVTATPPPTDNPLTDLATILIRPDGHVAWVGTGADDPTPALHRWFGIRAPDR